MLPYWIKEELSKSECASSPSSTEREYIKLEILLYIGFVREFPKLQRPAAPFLSCCLN